MFLRLLAVFLLVSVFAQKVVPKATLVTSPLKPRAAHRAATSALQSQFGGLHTELTNAQGSLQEAYEKNDAQSVTATFTKLQISFQNLASTCSQTYNQNRESPSDFAIDFIKALIEFQSLLPNLKSHPAFLDECTYTFRGTSVSINAVISFLKAGHVDLKSEVGKHGKKLDLNLFSECGFRINKFS